MMALVLEQLPARVSTVWRSLRLFGAAMLYGASVITPAISVLSAIEGLGSSRLDSVDGAARPSC
jgi:KUP system potassium uptake protein